MKIIDTLGPLMKDIVNHSGVQSKEFVNAYLAESKNMKEKALSVP